jgi:hypothetical protein
MPIRGPTPAYKAGLRWGVTQRRFGGVPVTDDNAAALVAQWGFDVRPHLV